MKVKELLDILRYYERKDERLNPFDPVMDYEVVIITSDGGMGPTSAVGIKSIGAGIDWDKGRMMIMPKCKLSYFVKERKIEK